MSNMTDQETRNWNDLAEENARLRADLSEALKRHTDEIRRRVKVAADLDRIREANRKTVQLYEDLLKRFNAMTVALTEAEAGRSAIRSGDGKWLSTLQVGEKWECGNLDVFSTAEAAMKHYNQTRTP